MSTPLPPIYRDCRRLLVLTEDMVRRFSRYHQYTVGTDLRQLVMGIMRTVNQAVHDKPRQTQHVQTLVWRVDYFKITLQLSRDVGVFAMPAACACFTRWCRALKARRQPLARPANRLAAPRHPQALDHSLPNFYGDHTMNKPVFASLLAATLLTPAVWAQTCPTWPTADRFTLNGSEVTDKRTGLTWKRCSEGQAWNGTTCTGISTIHTHEEALALAKTANSSQSATGWRLPNVKELASLADKGCQIPAIDSTAFPATSSNWFWSSSPYVGDSGNAWGVIFNAGYVGPSNRYGYYHVRLVRASQ